MGCSVHVVDAGVGMPVAELNADALVRGESGNRGQYAAVARFDQRVAAPEHARWIEQAMPHGLLLDSRAVAFEVSVRAMADARGRLLQRVAFSLQTEQRRGLKHPSGRRQRRVLSGKVILDGALHTAGPAHECTA